MIKKRRTCTICNKRDTKRFARDFFGDVVHIKCYAEEYGLDIRV